MQSEPSTHPPSLQDEIKQSRPFPSPSHEAALGVLRTADGIRRIITSVLDPYGVTPQQYNVLRILRGAGPDGLPTLTIGERMIEQTPGITRLLDRLERKGWVTRQRCPADRRQVFCRITPQGDALLAQLDEPVDTVNPLVVGVLTDHELHHLIALLDKIRASHITTLSPSETTHAAHPSRHS